MSVSARTTTGDLVVPRQIVTDPSRCILQMIVDALHLWQGEWFLNTNEGFPWLQRIFAVEPPPSATEIAALLRQQILAVQGVVSVTAKCSINRSARAFSYFATGKMNTGATFQGGSGVPFTITGSP